MRGKKTGALLVALAVAVLLSSCGEKETGSVLSAYDYGYQAGEADEIAFEKPGADIRGICGNVLFFAQEASSSVMRYFAANLQTAEIGTIGDTPTNPAWGTDAGEPVQVGDLYYLAEAEEGFFDKYVRDFEVFGDYILLSNSLEMALYRLTEDGVQLAAKSGWPYEGGERTAFYPAESVTPQNGKALFCAHHFFWILDAEQGKVMVLPVPGLKVGSGDYCKSVFTDGKNVVYSIYHSGLPNRFTEYRIIPWADLEHGVSQTISLEPGKTADLGAYSYCERFEKEEDADPRETTW